MVTNKVLFAFFFASNYINSDLIQNLKGEKHDTKFKRYKGDK
jgi:hypothetical protein